MEAQNTVFNSISVSYQHKKGSEAQATVVFIHGFPFDKSIWDKQMAALPESIDGLAYDIRGFGKSSSGHQFFSIDLFAKDLIQLINHLRLENVILCGISMGGYIALRAFEIAREKIKGMVLCDTNCVADTNEGKLKRFDSIELVTSGKKEEFTENFLRNVFSDYSQQFNSETVSLVRNLIMNTSAETICSAQLALASRTETSQVLAGIRVPALIIRGEHDKLMSAAQTQQLVDGIPDAGYNEIAASGHLPNLENPEQFNSCLNTYLHKHFMR